MSTKVQLSIAPPLYAALQSIAEDRGMALAAVVRMAALAYPEVRALMGTMATTPSQTPATKTPAPKTSEAELYATKLAKDVEMMLRPMTEKENVYRASWPREYWEKASKLVDAEIWKMTPEQRMARDAALDAHREANQFESDVEKVLEGMTPEVARDRFEYSSQERTQKVYDEAARRRAKSSPVVSSMDDIDLEGLNFDDDTPVKVAATTMKPRKEPTPDELNRMTNEELAVYLEA